MRLLLPLAVLVLSLPAFGREYFLAPGGDDANSGAKSAPWRSLAKASAALAPGDTLTLLPGVYPGCLEPAVSGAAGKPITYRSAQPLGARLSGGAKSSDGLQTCVRLKGRSYVILEGLDLTPDVAQMWLQMQGCDHCVLRGCRMQKGGMAFAPANIVDSNYNRFEHLDVSRAVQLDANGLVNGNMFSLDRSSHNVIQDCSFGKTGHDPFCLWPGATYNVVRRCVFSNVWGRDFEFFTAPHTLIEGCVITNTYHGSGSADGRPKLFIWEGIFRRNLLYRNWYQPLTIHAYQYEKMDPFGMVNSRLYHNTFYRNYESGFEMFDIAAQPDPHMVRGNVVQNNLFANNDPGGDGLQLGLGPNIAPDNVFSHNLFYGGKPNVPTIRYGWPAPVAERPQSQLRTPAEAARQCPEQFVGNRDGDPRFVNVDRDDYRLAAGSPAREAGAPLTRTREAGHGTVLPVLDARCFYDGFGIPDEAGDLLFVGSRKQVARVLKADAQTQTLTLDRPLTWATGDAVALPYTGSAPDLGAYEAGAEKQPWYMAPAPFAALRIPTMETADGPYAVCGFEPENLESWFYWWYAHRQRNSEAKVDDTTAHSGRRSLCLYATGDKSTLSALIRPPWWDIDRYPFVKFAYRIPRGVPVGLRLDAFESEARGSAAYVGGSPARATNERDLKQVALIDDDQWHEATVDVRLIRKLYPDVKLLRTFWFYTNGNGTQGQQFWFDDFRIERTP